MSTERCDSEVYSHGQAIAWLSGSKEQIEHWVSTASALSGLRLDWYYVGGMGRLLYLGDEAGKSLALRTLAEVMEGK